MKRSLALLLCLCLTLSFTACRKPYDEVQITTTDKSQATTTTTTLDEVLDYIDQHTTTTEYPDGTTVVDWTTATQKPVIPTKSTVKTTTRSRYTGTTAIVTTASTTTTVPPPIPTLPPTTTTTTTATTATTAADGTTTDTTTATTTVKKFEYNYVSGQKHTPLPLEERYLYSLLDDEMKAYYRQIDEAVNNLEPGVEFGVIENFQEDSRYQIFHLYLFDNPQHVYLTNNITIFNHGDGSFGLKFSYAVGNGEGEFCGYGQKLSEINDELREKVRAKKATFDAAVEAVISTIPVSAPDAVKERMIYDRILLDSHYNLAARWDGLAEDNWTAYGIMVNHYGVCESYSEAFQALCHAVGINATCVVGSAGGGHKWNCVKLDGEWYMCDITFDDPMGGDPEDAYHHYFNLTSEQMRERNHTWSAMESLEGKWDGEWPVPDCTATKYSWDRFVDRYGE